MSIAIRSKWAIAQYGFALAVVLALVGVVAIGGAWSVYTDPPTEQVTQTVDRQQFSTSMETSAVVTGETSLYRQGQTLENKPVYFFNATRNVTLEVTLSVPEDERVSVTQRLVFRHRAARDDEPFWTSRRLLASDHGNVTDGNATVESSIDMRSVSRDIRERREEIGPIGALRSELVLNVTYESRNHTGNLNTTTPVVFSQRAYWFEDPLTANQTHSTTRTTAVTGSPNLGSVLALGGLGVLAIGLAAGLVAVQYRGIDINVVETELARTRYEEWISRGEIPTKAEKQYIRIDTLEDLVDIAIDSNKRVIYDDSYDAYGVVDGDVVYYYAEGEAEFTQWLDI